MDLQDTLRHTPQAIFAVVDGALVQDLPERLAGSGLRGRPLYEGGMQDVGIHLVPLDTDDALTRLMDILGPAAPAVFWSWPGSEESLFRHLRTLGKVEAPKDGTNPADPEYEMLLFRHADPAALMAVLEVLTDEQREAFFEDARGLVFSKRDHRGQAGVVRVPRDGRFLRGAMTAVPGTQ